MEIELIKWTAEYAEGFRMESDLIKHIRSGQVLECPGIDNWYFYFSFLHSAIEGINKKGDWFISLRQDRIWIYQNADSIPLQEIPGMTVKSKEQALKYIHELEKKA